MTKIDIISGFLGAGKTTLIKKLLKEALNGQKVVLIENEFGEIGIDGGFLKEAGVQITEMNSGCICCSLVGDFGKALEEVLSTYHPERIIIEPSGVGKLSDVIAAVQKVAEKNSEVEMNSFVTVADASKCKMYMKNFGEFYNNQIESASAIILSRTQNVKEERLETCLKLIREHNKEARIITTSWDQLTGMQILEVMEGTHDLAEEMLREQAHDVECEHDHHHHDGECGHGHHHHDEECEHDHHHHDEEECEHGHHHHDEEECEHGHHHHDEEECEHEHHHHDEECEHGHHHHDGECHHDHHHEGCGCGHDHHHHHADEVFTSWGRESIHKYTKEQLESILKQLSDGDEYGIILRAKGMLPTPEGEWLYFDLVPEEYEIRMGSAEYTGRICVIGSKLQEEKLEQLFQL